MNTPLFEFEGTWEEIAARIPNFSSRKLRILVFPGSEQCAQSPENRPIAEVLAEIAGEIPAAELVHVPADLSDQLDHYVYGTPKR